MESRQRCEACDELVAGEPTIGPMHRRCVERLLDALRPGWRLL